MSGVGSTILKSLFPNTYAQPTSNRTREAKKEETKNENTSPSEKRDRRTDANELKRNIQSIRYSLGTISSLQRDNTNLIKQQITEAEKGTSLLEDILQKSGSGTSDTPDAIPNLLKNVAKDAAVAGEGLLGSLGRFASMAKMGTFAAGMSFLFDKVDEKVASGELAEAKSNTYHWDWSKFSYVENTPGSVNAKAAEQEKQLPEAKAKPSLDQGMTEVDKHVLNFKSKKMKFKTKSLIIEADKITGLGSATSGPIGSASGSSSSGGAALLQLSNGSPTSQSPASSGGANYPAPSDGGSNSGGAAATTGQASTYTGSNKQVLDTIKSMEAGGNYSIVNGAPRHATQEQNNELMRTRASGAYQFMPKTWASLTKKFNIGTQYQYAAQAPAEVQDALASAYVSDILKRNNNDVGTVPLEWYTGNSKGIISPAALAANGGLTPDTYKSRWLQRFNKIGSQYPAATSNNAVPVSVSPIKGESPEQLAKRVQAVNPTMSPQECAIFAMHVAGMNGTVRDWRRGDAGGGAPTGTPLATFMNPRTGQQSQRYDDGGIGTHKRDTFNQEGTSHAVIKVSDVTDPSRPPGQQHGIKVWNTWKGAGGAPHMNTYWDNDPRGGESDALNYRTINDASGAPAGKNNPLRIQYEAAKNAPPPVEEYKDRSDRLTERQRVPVNPPSIVIPTPAPPATRIATPPAAPSPVVPQIISHKPAPTREEYSHHDSDPGPHDVNHTKSPDTKHLSDGYNHFFGYLYDKSNSDPSMKVA